MRFGFLSLWVSLGLILPLSSALAANTLPPSKSVIPQAAYTCSVDANCTVVQGWCSVFSINRAYLPFFKSIPSDPNGKGARNCPGGWSVPDPRAACQKNRCQITSQKRAVSLPPPKTKYTDPNYKPPAYKPAPFTPTSPQTR